MPTSSQALILKGAVGRLVSADNGKTTPSCSFEKATSCPIAKVYNLVGSIPGANVRLVDQTSPVQSHKGFPQTFSSKVWYDRRTSEMRWEMVNTGVATATDVHKADSVPLGIGQTQNRNTDTRGTFRPKTASSVKTFVSPFVYESLVGLGFRKNALAKSEDCVYDGFSGRKAAFPETPSRSKMRKTSLLSSSEEEEVAESAKNQAEPDRECREEERKSSRDDDSDSESIDLEGYHRIKPSLHMRKDVPEARPTAAIFSFRDNEFSSHAEVKFLIETQIYVKVKSVQFDPLDIRYARSDVHSRWIVDFFSVFDLERAVSKGLILGKDKILFYRHDDVATREVNTFKYFMTIQEAKKRLKSSALLRKSKSAKYNGNQKSVVLRSAKSQNTG